MKTTGYNSLKSWGIVISCSIIYCLLTLPYKTVAFFFVAILDRFDTNRANASLFIVVSGLLRSFAGPVTGFLSEIIGIRGLTVVGCLLSALGMGVCFFAENIVIVNVFMGLIYGVGMTLGVPLLPQAIKQHFDKNITNANGVFHAGSSIATFCIIPLVSFLLNTYGLSGALLLTGGIMLHAVPVAMLLRDPKYKKEPPEDVVKELVAGDTNEINNKASNTCSIGIGKLAPESSCEMEKCELKSYMKYGFEESGAVSKSNNQDSKTDCVVNGNFLSGNHVDSSTESDDCTTQFNDKHIDCKVKGSCTIDDKSQMNTLHPLLSNENGKNPTSNNIPSKYESDKLRAAENKNKFKFRQALKTLTIFKDPSFLVIMICQSVHGYVGLVVFTIIIDYSRDKNIKQELEQYFIMSFTVFQIVGYTCLGWLIDKGYMKTANFMAICFAFLGLSCFVMTLSNSFLTLILSTAGFGIFIAALYSSAPSLIYQFISEKKQTMAMSAGVILQAPLSFTLAPLIGHFRGQLGSYDGALYLLTGVCIGCAILLFLLPHIHKCSIRRNKRTSNNISL